MKLFGVLIGGMLTEEIAEETSKEFRDMGFRSVSIVEITDDSFNSSDHQQLNKPIEEVACEVIRGEWGIHEEQRERLENAGYDYSEIKRLIDEIRLYK